MKSTKKPTYQELEVEIAELKLRYQFLKENGQTLLSEGLENGLLENKQHSTLLLENMPSAFVYGKIIYKKNKPVNFEFIELNRAFY